MELVSNWKRIRKFLNDIHLWLGIASGLIVFIVCLTGTLYVFHSEIDAWINSDKYQVKNAVTTPLSVEQLIERVNPQVDGRVTSVNILPSQTETYQFSVSKEGERRGTTYLINPYTGEVTGNTTSGTSEFFMFIFRMHRWLLLDTNIGRPIVGVSTLIFVFLILTGLVIWIPQKAKSWRQGLKIKWSGNWKRINHDLHNTLGLYAAIFLLIMGLTGLQWSFDWYRTGLRSVLGVEQGHQRAGSGGKNSNEQDVMKEVPNEIQLTPLSISRLMHLTDQELPYTGTYRIEAPDSQKKTVRIDKYHSGFFASPASDVIILDAYTGKLISREVFSEKPFNEKIARSIKALHVGDVFGTFSKIIYFITCLIATSMPITGTIIWINKLKKKSSKRKKEKQLATY